MGYDVSTVVFYGIEIDDPGSDRWEELFATVDMHFLYYLGCSATGATKAFIVRDETFTKIAWNNQIETDVVDIAERLFAMTLEERDEIELFCFNKSLTIKEDGAQGWIVGAHGS